jgi:predicted PurR-regulated permease PerM
MERKDDQAGPVLIVAVSTVIVGLASFVVWLLRLKPRVPQEKPAAQLPGQPSQPDLAAGGATPVVPGAEAAPAVLPADSMAQQGAKLAMTSPEPSDFRAGTTTAPEASAAPTANTQWATPTRYLAAIGLILAVLGLIYYSRQTLSLLIFAALIAILARPGIGFLHKRLHFPTGLAAIAVYLAIGALLFVLPLLIGPNIIRSFNSLLNIDWQGFAQRLAEWLDQAAAQLAATPLVGGLVSDPFQSLADDLQNLLSGMPSTSAADVTMESMISGLGQAVGLLADVVGPLVSGIVSLVFLLLISLQMSLAGDQVRGWVIGIVPARFETEIGALLDRISLVWVSFLRGQFALMVVMGILVWLMNWALGTPQALLLGLLAGLLEVIPSLGPTLAAVPAALLALLFGSAHFPGLNPAIFMLIVIAGYILLNLLENQVLVPQILGDAVNLPPLIVLVGVTIAGAQAGIAGIFLATPMIATGRELFTYVYDKIREVPDIQPPEEDKPSLRDRFLALTGRFRLPSRRTAEQS